MDQRDRPALVFLGFCAKEHWPTPHPWTEPVTEICSVSDCISSRPLNWIERWDFNRASCWNDESLAWACVPDADRHRFRLFAYRAFPLVFGKTGLPEHVLPDEMFSKDLPPLPNEAGLSAYEKLGYDVVQYANLLNWGCSPLSCNGMAEQFAVNKYCLIED